MNNDTYAFIVRIWHEAVDNQGDIIVWRGSIDRVGQEKRLYFHDLEGINRFIQEQIGIQTKQSVSWWRSVLNWIQYEVSKFRSRLQS